MVCTRTYTGWRPIRTEWVIGRRDACAWKGRRRSPPQRFVAAAAAKMLMMEARMRQKGEVPVRCCQCGDERLIVAFSMSCRRDAARNSRRLCVCVCCCSMHRSLQWMASGFIARENRWRKEEYGHRSSPCHRLISGLSSPPYHMLCNWIGLLSLSQSLIWSDAMQCAQPLFPSHDYIDCILPLWDDYTKNELIAFCSQNAL